jgi:transposase-like protein
VESKVLYQIRNLTKYVVWKDKKEFTRDLKAIYTVSIREMAKAALDDFKVK